MDFCISDECTFGDFKGLLRPSMQTCAEMIRYSPWMCYPGRGGEHCCTSCAKLANKENAGKHSSDLSQCKTRRHFSGMQTDRLADSMG